MNLSKLMPFFYLFLLYFFLKVCFGVLAPFLCGFLLAKIISRNNKTSSILLYFILLFFFAILFLSLLYFFYTQLKPFYFEFPHYLTLITNFLNTIDFPFSQLHDMLLSLLQSIFPLISNLLILLPKAFSFFCMTFFYAFLFLFDIHALGRILYHFSPYYFNQAQKLQSLLFQTLTSMIISSFKLFIITWAECFLAFLLLQHAHAFFYSFLIACFDSMPLVGVGFILLPYALYLFIIQSNQAFAIFLTYLLITLLRFFIEPKIISKQLDIPLLLHLFMMVISTKLFGFIGFLYSPILCVLLRVWYTQKKAG